MVVGGIGMSQNVEEENFQGKSNDKDTEVTVSEVNMDIEKIMVVGGIGMTHNVEEEIVEEFFQGKINYKDTDLTVSLVKYGEEMEVARNMDGTIN